MATLEEHVTRLKNEHSELYKVVNGARSKLSDSEYDAQIDAWAANDKAQEDRDTVVNDGGSHADYKEIRKEAYLKDLGDWGDQLDMIYKDIDDWKAKVKAIKDKYTKP
jgi:hypothetical protein